LEVDLRLAPMSDKYELLGYPVGRSVMSAK
jgi:hypothetical protein